MKEGGVTLSSPELALLLSRKNKEDLRELPMLYLCDLEDSPCPAKQKPPVGLV